MNVKSPIVVLNTLRYADDKIIAECLSRSEGRVTFLVRISHAKRAAVRHSLFQPLALLEAEWTPKLRGGLISPKSAVVLTPYAGLHSTPVKQMVVLFLSEALLHILRNEEGSELLFDFIAHSLEWFDTAPSGYANFHIVFLMRLARFLGIMPSLDSATLPHFDLLEGQFRATPPPHRHYISGREAEAFAQLMRMNFGTMQLFALSRTERQRILFLILEYYRLHLPIFPELKSLEVLSEVFD